MIKIILVKNNPKSLFPNPFLYVFFFIISCAIASGLIIPLHDGQKGIFVQNQNFLSDKNESKLTETDITFNHIVPFGKDCVMIYGDISSMGDDFLLKDCGGSTFRRKWIFDIGYIQSMTFTSEKSGWFVFRDAVMKIESIDGEVFEGKIMRKEPDEFISDAFFFNERQGWICGKNGIIYKTEDGGLTWKRQESNTKFDLRTIRFINAQEGWASGVNTDESIQEVLLRTTNGGEEWIPTELGKGIDLSELFFTSLWHGCTTNEKNAIVCTNDGQTWKVVYSDKGEQKRNIFFLNAEKGWIAGDCIWHTANGGETWKKQFCLPKDVSNDFDKVLFINEELGWALSLNEVWMTNNGGKTWLRVSENWIADLKKQQPKSNSK